MFPSSATVEAQVFMSVLKCVSMSTERLNRITSNPRQCGGRPCIRGMRIRVKDVLDMLAGGASEEEILADFPYLEPDDIRASLEYAAAQIDHAVGHGLVVNFLVDAQLPPDWLGGWPTRDTQPNTSIISVWRCRRFRDLESCAWR
jgi:uncharacterized protein (DUF433 family)